LSFAFFPPEFLGAMMVPAFLFRLLAFGLSIFNLLFLVIWITWHIVNLCFGMLRDGLSDRQGSAHRFERLWTSLKPSKDEMDFLRSTDVHPHKEFRAERATVIAFFNILALEPQNVITRVCATIGWHHISVRSGTGESGVEIFKREQVVIVSFCTPFSAQTNTIKDWLTGEFSRNHEIAKSRIGVRAFYTRTLTNSFKIEFLAQMDNLDGPLSLYFSGHGIAAGVMMACVAQLLLNPERKFKHQECMSVYSFGQPRVLSKSAVNDPLLGGGVPIFRCTTFFDPLPRGFDLLPARLLNLVAEYVVHRSSRDMTHIGREIRLLPFANRAQEYNADGHFLKDLPFKFPMKYPVLRCLLRMDVGFDAETYFHQFCRLIRH
jgi:hypothetical protein